MTRFVEINGGQHMAEVHDKPPAHCHRQVRDTAEGIAAAFYEMAASDNDFYKLWPSQRRFVKLKWGAFVKDARQAMGEMLGRDDVPEEIKAAVYEALQMDAAAKGGDVQVITH